MAGKRLTWKEVFNALMETAKQDAKFHEEYLKKMDRLCTTAEANKARLEDIARELAQLQFMISKRVIAAAILLLLALCAALGLRPQALLRLLAGLVGG